MQAIAHRILHGADVVELGVGKMRGGMRRDVFPQHARTVIETQFKVRSITRRKTASSAGADSAASVKNIAIMVAMFGSIIPTPLATPTIRALPTVADAVLGTVSVVMMPRATWPASVPGSGEGMAASPARM